MTASDKEESPGISQFMHFIIQELDFHEGGYLSSEELYHRIKEPVRVNTIDDKLPNGTLPRRAATVGDAGGHFIFVK